MPRSSGMRKTQEPQGSLLDSGIRTDAALRDPRSGSFYYTVQGMSQESLRKDAKDAKVTSLVSSYVHPALKTTT